MTTTVKMPEPADPTKAIKDALEAGPTPGPWTVTGLGGPWEQQLKIRAEKWGIVAHVGVDPGLPHWDAPQRANARLIAACSPEAMQSLLSRLEEAESLLERIYRNPENVSFPETLLAKDLAAAMKEQSHG